MKALFSGISEHLSSRIPTEIDAAQTTKTIIGKRIRLASVLLVPSIVLTNQSQIFHRSQKDPNTILKIRLRRTLQP